MAIEAEIIDVTRPGENINILVAYRENGVEFTRETMMFNSSDITSALVTQAIKDRGQKIQGSKSAEVLAKNLIGQKIPIS